MSNNYLKNKSHLTKRILVTGANGYLGRGVVACLLNDGYQVVATDFDCSNVDNRSTKICCNIFDLDNPFIYFNKPDIVLHLAWRNGFEHNSSSHLEDFWKHYMFLKKMIDAGVGKVAVIGTMHEIGFFEGCVDENTPCNPLTLYGISKNALRQSLQMQCSISKTRFQWLRCYYIVSNTPYGNSIFSKLIRASQERNSSFPFSTGTNQYDFLAYDECCERIAASVEQDSILGIIEICSGVPQTLSSQIESFIRDNKLGIRLEYGKYASRAYDSRAIWGNSLKINQIMKDRH